MDNSGLSEDFGPRLRATRNSANLTLADVATRIGKGISTISDWEKGKSEPSLGDIRALAMLLGCDAGILAFGISGKAVAPASIVEEAQAPYGAAESLRQKLDRTILAAGENRDRLGWIAVQLDTHLRPPAQWIDDAAAVREAKRLINDLNASKSVPPAADRDQRSG